MLTPERCLFSHTEGQHSAGLEFSVPPELVERGTDQLSPEPAIALNSINYWEV